MEAPLYILGSGIAGTTLSVQLLKAGVDHYVFDQEKLSRSSRIAAGLANPVVLKRQKWVKGADLFLPASRQFFDEYEREHGLQIKFESEIEHIFHKVGEVNDWLINSTKPLLNEHLGAINRDVIKAVESPYGRGILKNIFWLDTQAYIQNHKENLRKLGRLIETEWPGLDALKDNARVIYCNGHLLRESHPSMAKAFGPTKGELMIIKADNLPSNRILHAGVFTLPLGNNLFKVGASYAHQNLNDQASAKGLSSLEEKLRVFYKGPYEIIEQVAGVRPNIKDRKPLLGKLNDQEYIFNGMGSRGVLMAPYLAAHFIDFFQKGNGLRQEWDLNRFI